ncbi:hypothetical protein Q4560_04320 [Celeribacter halophilus]|uniref:Site-specific DNA-methyltransferase (adenine-specific) n=1 Tax=Celeribacter halophilus TaxID=576117 RepID=A0AAW7XYT1_9RHOB|nr:hypothetical protein [Celeribacter halophilus]MDO6458004.1 hypothetical protein [Celeribacter halophilus]MDO6722483.1 hypothetical protein [Celeribacter halophilus]
MTADLENAAIFDNHFDVRFIICLLFVRFVSKKAEAFGLRGAIPNGPPYLSPSSVNGGY